MSDKNGHFRLLPLMSKSNVYKNDLSIHWLIRRLLFYTDSSYSTPVVYIHTYKSFCLNHPY